MGKNLVVRPEKSTQMALPDVRGRKNPYFIPRPHARSLLLQRITEHPGRYTVVDLVGITGITTNRINRFLRDDKEFAKLAAKGAIAVPLVGRRPFWFNKKTPIVKESYYKGAFAMTTFSMRGEKGITTAATRIFDATRAALVSSNRAPQTILLLQDTIRAELLDYASDASKKVTEAKKITAAQRRLTASTNAAAKAEKAAAEQKANEAKTAIMTPPKVRAAPKKKAVTALAPKKKPTASARRKAA